MHSYLINEIVILEKIQRQATKFILRDFNSDYRTCLLKLDLYYRYNVYFGPLLPSYIAIIFIKALKQP